MISEHAEPLRPPIILCIKYKVPICLWSTEEDQKKKLKISYKKKKKTNKR